LSLPKPSFTKDHIDTSIANGKAVEKALKRYNSKECSVAEITEMTGVSKATLYRRRKELCS
jgi:DNA-binding IclR family transcriptional regulator